MEAAERTARQKEQAEKDKIERMNADLKEVRQGLVICWLCGSGSAGDDF
jgi:recombinational DNA repair protein RecR